jgi:hypothetical protein
MFEEMNEDKHKPIIETLINTAAIALSAFGVTLITKESCSVEQFVRGIILIVFAAGLEFFKYWGRKGKYW